MTIFKKTLRYAVSSKYMKSIKIYICTNNYTPHLVNKIYDKNIL